MQCNDETFSYAQHQKSISFVNLYFPTRISLFHWVRVNNLATIQLISLFGKKKTLLFFNLICKPSLFPQLLKTEKDGRNNNVVFSSLMNGYESISPQEDSIPLLSISCLLSPTLFITHLTTECSQRAHR